MKSKRTPKWFEWTVKLRVHKSWVADGYDLDDERAHNMLAYDLRYARNSEISAKVVKHPKKAAIKKAQSE